MYVWSVHAYQRDIWICCFLCRLFSHYLSLSLALDVYDMFSVYYCLPYMLNEAYMSVVCEKFIMRQRRCVGVATD